MLRLNRYILALVVWLAFVFNIERFDIGVGRSDLFNISLPVYIGIVGLVILSFLVPQWKRVPLWAMLLLGVVVFVGAVVMDDRPARGGMYTYLSLFELGITLVTVGLAFMLGQLSANLVETLDDLSFSDMSKRIAGRKDAVSLAQLHIEYSQRTNSPLTVAVLEVNADNAPIELSMTAKDLQPWLTKRYRLTSLTRFLAQTIRRTDFVFDRGKHDQLILLAPNMHKAQSAALVERLCSTAQPRLGVKLRCGVASFPQQGATFDALLARAEQGLLSNVQEGQVVTLGNASESIAVQPSATADCAVSGSRSKP